MLRRGRLALEHAWESYNTSLIRHPIAVTSITACAMYGAGDCIAQNIEKSIGAQSTGKTGYNFPRTARMMTFGLLVGGPVLALWYPMLHRMTLTYRKSYTPVLSYFRKEWVEVYRKEEKTEPVERLSEAAMKLMCDNLFFQPPFITLYLFTMGMIEGRSLRETYLNTQQNFHDIWGTGFLVWLPAQAINFAFVPVYLQASYVMVVNMFWKALMSIMYHVRDYGTRDQRKVTLTEREFKDMQQELQELRGLVEQLHRSRKVEEIRQGPELAEDSSMPLSLGFSPSA